MPGLDLRQNIFQDTTIGHEPDVNRRRRRDRFLLAPRFGRPPGSGSPFAVPRIATAFLVLRRTRASVAPVAAATTAPSIATAPIALARRQILFAGKVSITIFGRRFLYPGG
ncbi:MAG: hypothetical protein ABIR29_14025 [Chthoniobacterales bacterium]